MDEEYKGAKLEMLKKLRKDLSQLIADEGGDEEMSNEELSEKVEDAAEAVEVKVVAPEIDEDAEAEEAFNTERREYFQGSDPMPEKKEGRASVIVPPKSYKAPSTDMSKSIGKALGAAPKKKRSGGRRKK